MFFIDKKLIYSYNINNLKYVYTKQRTCLVTKHLLGKTFIVYNGKKWLRKDIDTFYCINKNIANFKNLETRKISVFKSKKKKQLLKKKK